MIEYKMPSLGADMESGFLREWRVKPGDRINKGDIIADVETQKGIIEVEVFDDGIIGELLVKVDQQVPVGTTMATILTSEENKPERDAVKKDIPTAENGKKNEEAQDQLKEERPSEQGYAPTPKPDRKEKPPHIRASPLARKVASEKGIDIATVHGTGPEGAITRDDVMHATEEKTGAPPLPKQEPGISETEKLPPAPSEAETALTTPTTAGESIRMAVAAAMSRSNREIPHYYLETKIDMSHTLKWLAEENKQREVKERLLPAVMQIKAVARALAEVPDLNAWWENGLQRKESINIGYVVALRTGGIVVPTLHDADNKSLDELMQDLNTLIPRARALRLRSSDISESTITVTSLGEGAVETVYGVIYPPQVALVGFGGITEQPWAENGMLAARPVLVVTLAADHRASDGNTGNKFLKALKHYLQHPDEL